MDTIDHDPKVKEWDALRINSVDLVDAVKWALGYAEALHTMTVSAHAANAEMVPPPAAELADLEMLATFFEHANQAFSSVGGEATGSSGRLQKIRELAEAPEQPHHPRAPVA